MTNSHYAPDSWTLTGAARRGGWPDAKLTEAQCKLALEAVKANALNDSDYEHLRNMLGLNDDD